MAPRQTHRRPVAACCSGGVSSTTGARTHGPALPPDPSPLWTPGPPTGHHGSRRPLRRGIRTYAVARTSPSGVGRTWRAMVISVIECVISVVEWLGPERDVATPRGGIESDRVLLPVSRHDRRSGSHSSTAATAASASPMSSRSHRCAGRHHAAGRIASASLVSSYPVKADHGRTCR